MAYGYHPATHTPEGYVRTGRATPRKAAHDDTEKLKSILWGYTSATREERKAAYETLKARGVDV